MLFNNFGYLSIVRLDTNNKIHCLEKVQNRKRTFCSSSGFFKNRFESLVAVSYFGKHSEVYDIEKRLPISKFDTLNSSYSTGSSTSAIFYDKGEIKIFDIRTPFGRNNILSVRMDSAQADTQCLDINKESHSMLVSLDTGCVYYDLRKEGKSSDEFGEFLSTDQTPKSPLMKTSSFCHSDHMDQLTSKPLKSKTKNWLLSADRGLVADFMEQTLNLYNFSTGKIEKSLQFGHKLLDVSVQKDIGRIATLVSAKDDSEVELALFDLDLFNHETLDLSSQAPDNLGFIGTDGLLITHGRGHFNVFNTVNTHLGASMNTYFNSV